MLKYIIEHLAWSNAVGRLKRQAKQDKTKHKNRTNNSMYACVDIYVYKSQCFQHTFKFEQQITPGVPCTVWRRQGVRGGGGYC